jgi:hypothetical protein
VSNISLTTYLVTETYWVICESICIIKFAALLLNCRKFQHIVLIYNLATRKMTRKSECGLKSRKIAEPLPQGLRFIYAAPYCAHSSILKSPSNLGITATECHVTPLSNPASGSISPANHIRRTHNMKRHLNQYLPSFSSHYESWR